MKSSTDRDSNRPHVAILLCAGYGTRMGSLTQSTPKPLLPVAGRPQLDYLLDQIRGLGGIGAVHVVSNAHYFEAFERWATQTRAATLPASDASEDREIRLVVHNDGTTSNEDRLGAIGDLGFVLDRIDAPAGALVCAGDNILRFRLAPFWQGFRSRKETSVLALHEPNPERLKRTGVLEAHSDQGLDKSHGPSTGAFASRVKRLHEKPESPPSSWSCPSFYALDAPSLERVPDYLAEGRPADEIGRLLGDLAERRPVWAHHLHGERLHVGRPDELQWANALLRSEAVIIADGEAVKPELPATPRS